MDKKIPVIIDTDPGHDDAIALLLALKSEKLDVRAVTVCAGNQTLDKTVDNTLKILSYANIDIPVGIGFDKPIVRELITAPEVHGDSGLDGPVLPEATLKPVDMHAIDLMAKTIRESDDKVVIIPLGPLTNVGMFIHRYPELLSKVERISLMGGAIHGGNWTPSAEFNILVDPEAADIVFRSGIPITMSGLDVTHKANVHFADIETIRNIGNPVATMVAELLDFFVQNRITDDFDGCHMHDPTAVSYVIAPEIFKTQKMNVQIELNGKFTTGQTVGDVYDRLKLDRNVDVALDIDREAFVNLIIESLKKY